MWILYDFLTHSHNSHIVAPKFYVAIVAMCLKKICVYPPLNLPATTFSLEKPLPET